MGKLLYDEASIPSIVEYAQRLENKGAFGNYLEEAYFGKKSDNKSQADFPLAHLELKASP